MTGDNTLNKRERKRAELTAKRSEARINAERSEALPVRLNNNSLSSSKFIKPVFEGKHHISSDDV